MMFNNPFRESAGRGVRVAVIDSGVNPRHPHISSIAGGVAIDAVSSGQRGSYIDALGHGTAVMAAIQEKAPEAEYFAVKIFDRTLSTNAGLLLQSIQWCIDNGMHVVNLSLGTSNPQHRGSLAVIVAKAVEKGMVLVSAREVDGQPYFPGSVPDVIGVELDWSCDRNSYRIHDSSEGPVFCASGYPRPIPGVPVKKNLHGISFAVANMTGFVIRACGLSNRNSFDRIQSALIAGAKSC